MIGAGGFGLVFLVEEVSSQELRAVKYLQE